MLRRGPDSDLRWRRPGDADTGDPFLDEPAAAPAPAPYRQALRGWTAPLSYLDLEPRLVSELARAAMGSTRLVLLPEGEVAVGAMLASLAIRGEDPLLDELLVVSSAELQLQRYSVGQLNPLAVHTIGSVAELLRALAFCATSSSQESWEALATDGRHPPVAIASARRHELRWLQPPAQGAPNNATWMTPTSLDAPTGTSVSWWEHTLRRPALPPSALLDRDGPPISLGPISAGAAPTVASSDLLDSIRAVIDEALSSALVELELEPGTLAELTDTSVLERLVDSVVRMEERLQQVEQASRGVQELTGVVQDLTEAARALMRHQWDNMPPQNFWVKIQRADDDLRRALEELTTEVRSRAPKRAAAATKSARSTSK